MDVGLGLWTMRSTAAFPGAHPQLYADLVTDAQLAEELGFHSLWVAEHHFSCDGWCPAPLVAAASVLAATTTLRVGSGVHLLPLYEPERAFAEVDWLHRLSGGRFDHGVGIGYRAAEYDGYGLSRKVRGRRMDAALEHFAAAGSAAPIWVGGMAEPAVKRAARFGLNLLLPSTLRLDQTARAIDTAREAAAVVGREPGRFAVMKYTWATDGTEADRLAAIEVHRAFTREYTAAWFPGIDSPEKVEAQLDRAIETGLFGSVEAIAAELRELEALGVDLVVLHLVGDGRRPERHAAMRRIAAELL
jgi:alkanesulfonate monooxygenase SsuD/methylene tetrahydromethanopterin reductase-like flavin-dependent oxidoreductase (luciferase family)